MTNPTHNSKTSGETNIISKLICKIVGHNLVKSIVNDWSDETGIFPTGIKTVCLRCKTLITYKPTN